MSAQTMQTLKCNLTGFVCMVTQAIESLDISDSLEVTAMTSKEKERVPFDTPMQASGTALGAGHACWSHGKP